jgi:hypothetical protein
MKRFFFATSFVFILSFVVLAQSNQQQINSDPEKAKFVTSDIDNFWQAFDLAQKETDKEKKIAIFQREYLNKGSVGLQDFVRMRIKSAKDLVETIENLPRFYASIRPSTLRIKEMEKRMRKSFRRFKEIYPDALFPDVYFLIGVANTGGTASKNGLLIGTELYGLTAQTPREEFPVWAKSQMPNLKDEELRVMINKYLDVALKPIQKIPAVVAHESCHFNQKYPKLDSLLAKSIQEGACDFIGEKISGELMNPAQKEFGEKHEAQLWREFQSDMKEGKNERSWMYNGLTAKDRPPDLGYFMGYKISQSFYKNSKDKQKAIRNILVIEDFPKFLEASRYAEDFPKK